jgi:hypothetical protein
VPCIIRRISIEIHGTDKTAYARDIFNEKFAQLPPQDDGRRNLADLAEFMRRFETSDVQTLMDEWPELYSANFDAKATINMYKRAVKETRAVFSQYPALAALLK